MNLPKTRTPQEVFEDHLRLRLEGKLEEDLQRNYAEDVLLLTVNSNAGGHDSIRMLAERLSQQLSQAEYRRAASRGAVCFPDLFARSTRFDAVEGADSFVIEDGKIVFQSIHYRLSKSRDNPDDAISKGVPQ